MEEEVDYGGATTCEENEPDERKVDAEIEMVDLGEVETVILKPPQPESSVMDLSKITEAVAAIEKEMPTMADKDMAAAIGAASSQSAAKAAPAKALAEVIDAAKA
eukprot:12446738-Prorocentrum_lima.AAC.1